MKDPRGRARHVATRSCVACRTVRPKRELVRVVRMPDGRVVLDESGRLAGRGAYICRDETCRSGALAKGAISRALGVPLTADVRAALESGGAGPPASTATMTMTTTTAHAPTKTMKDEGGDRGEE